ncbi:XRE family transcriptional regulator [Paenibacillus sp. NPDC057967]|uniref:XRE family transcriptional regulator n=1 Tax=Paenibacillus sp. NPDC057967 TaxID=3346293 RepID=UPI0036D93C9B
MARKRPITSLGWQIKQRLAALRMDQREFCKKYEIPENRLADIMTGARKAVKQTEKVKALLGITDEQADQQAL